MPQTTEAESFLKRIQDLPKNPGVSLEPALRPSLDDETELRRLFATEKANARLSNPYVGLVDVFEAPADIRVTRARVVEDEIDLSAKYVMPLADANRRKEGTPSMVADLDEFKKNWSIFTEGSLSQLLDWNNVVVAGGSVLACLTPLPETAKESKRSVRKFYHSAAYPTSDIDLFLWGMTPDQAEVKITKIYEAVRDSVPWDVTCVRTKHTVSIHSQYPYRSVQIVLRLYTSPAEILAGFDVDAPCCAYDGQRVWASPRAIVAMMRQCNTVDMTRRSPSYEVRLAKYSTRHFEVHIPSLRRSDVDPTIYERSIARIEGLARLLVFEKLKDADTRYLFLESRRNLRGRPNPLNRYNRRNKKYKGDLKSETTFGGLEMNDYDVVSLHIPYGPGWDARRIDRLIYQTDLGMNSTFNPKNKRRRLHRHPAFFGTMDECLEDCCQHCTEPIDEDERKLLEEEDKQYIRGRISFIEEDPGRQSLSGSFNPIDVGEWSGQVYIGASDKFFAAITSRDRSAVSAMIKDGSDVNHRDHVGRAPLHLAILCQSPDIACDLVDAGARITARLVDGRTALHLAAQFDQPQVIRKILDRSAVNAEKSNKVESDDEGDRGDQMAVDRNSSEDDWSSADDGVESMDDDSDGDDEGSDENDDDDDDDLDSDGNPAKKTAALESEPVNNIGSIPEDEENEPDIIDINLFDWDVLFTPLSYAILFASMPVIETLIAAGADVKLAGKSSDATRIPACHPLTLTIMRDDEVEASKIAERLVLAGASSSTADHILRTIFHHAVAANKAQLVSTLLRSDPKAKAVLDFPVVNYSDFRFPIISAIAAGGYSTLATILAYGAKVSFTEQDLSPAIQAARKANIYFGGDDKALNNVFFPIESALSNHDDVIHLLINLGADYDRGTRRSLRAYSSDDRRSFLDYVRYAVTYMDAKLSDGTTTPTVELSGWKACIVKRFREIQDQESEGKKTPNKDNYDLAAIRDYFVDVEKLLAARGAKTYNDLYNGTEQTFRKHEEPEKSSFCSYQKLTTHASGYYNREIVHEPMVPLYDELYDACFAGDNDKVKRLCMPSSDTESSSAKLQISVQVCHPTNRWRRTGYTPLYAAVCGRNWDTVGLVLSIATAQYQPKEKEKKFSVRDIDLDGSDSDGNSDSDDSGVSDDTVEAFTDVANQASDVKCDIEAREMLTQALVMHVTDPDSGKTTEETSDLIGKAIHDKDFEAFINIANLYNLLPQPIELGESVIGAVLQYDQPEMLDEFIRRTGLGITIEVVATKEEGNELESAGSAVNDKNRVYLGLSVHGKKRHDLARKNDPNATDSSEAVVENPILWKALVNNAMSVVDYLAGDRPLAAYRFYYSSHSGERAQKLKRTQDFEKLLPQWLGWTMTPFGESPLTAAVLGRKLETVKKLFAAAPALIKSSLHERVKFIGYNALMTAIDRDSPADTVDYLVGKGLSPVLTDQIRGWNILHIVCYRNNHKLLEHLLKKLPRDVVEVLLTQRSKDRQNTPLHIAVKMGHKLAVKAVLDFSKMSILDRDLDGFTPLHCAVKQSFSEIAKLLMDASPEALYIENGVGETVLEMATLKELVLRLTNSSQVGTRVITGTRTGDDLSSGDPPIEPPRLEVEHLEAELPRLRLAIERLLEEGRLVRGTKLTNELLAFAATMEEKLAAAKAGAKKPEDAEEPKSTDTADVVGTLRVLKDTMPKIPEKRNLVHLIDVQRSVQSNLAKSITVQEGQNQQTRDDEGLVEEEDDEEEKQRSSLLTFRTLGLTFADVQ